MRYTVLLTAGAERDLEEIHSYLFERESQAAADELLDSLSKLVTNLARLPNRGSHPKELLALGIQQYRQAILGPYRIIYRVADDRVYIHLVADARRDVQALLARRLLGG